MIGPKAIARGLLEVLFPPACAACGRVGREPFCRICAEALEDAPPFSIEGADRARALWAYGGPASLAVQRLKYDDRPELGRALGAALIPALEELGRLDAIVPVPLSPRRLRERGYNQARELARGLPLPVRARALARSNAAREQVGLDKEARRANLENAFQPGTQPVAGCELLLLDDVVTTGSTASAACRALLTAGARRVSVLALTYTV